MKLKVPKLDWRGKALKLRIIVLAGAPLVEVDRAILDMFDFMRRATRGEVSEDSAPTLPATPMPETLVWEPYKTEWAGGHLAAADRFHPSSKLCSVCGHKNEELKLSDRVWTCSQCGTRHDRDVNAARNLEKVACGLRDTLNACVTDSPGDGGDRRSRRETRGVEAPRADGEDSGMLSRSSASAEIYRQSQGSPLPPGYERMGRARAKTGT